MAKKRKKAKKRTIKIPIQSTKKHHEKKHLPRQTKIILIILLIIALLLLIVLIFSKDPTYKPKSTQTTIVVDGEKTRTLQSNTQATTVTNGSFCLKGQRIHFEGANSKADVTVVGIEFFENNYFCKAQDTKKFPSEVGDVTVKTEYYFENSGREVWFITTTTGNGFPPQVTTIHMIDGQIIAQ